MQPPQTSPPQGLPSNNKAEKGHEGALSLPTTSSSNHNGVMRNTTDGGDLLRIHKNHHHSPVTTEDDKNGNDVGAATKSSSPATKTTREDDEEEEGGPPWKKPKVDQEDPSSSDSGIQKEETTTVPNDDQNVERTETARTHGMALTNGDSTMVPTATSPNTKEKDTSDTTSPKDSTASNQRHHQANIMGDSMVSLSTTTAAEAKNEQETSETGETARKKEEEEGASQQDPIVDDEQPPEPTVTPPPPPPTNKHIRSKHVNPLVLEIRRRIQMSCRDNDLATAMDAYDEALAKNIRLEAQSFYNLLNLCDGLERSVHIGTPKPNTTNTSTLEKDTSEKDPSTSPPPPPPVLRHVSWKDRQDYAFRIKDHMAQLNLPLNETAYTAIVKVLSRNKEFVKGEQVLDEAERVPQCRPKLRLYASLLGAYCADARMGEALHCWRRLSQQRLGLTEKEYLSLMKCAIATGDILVMDRVLTNVAEEVTVPSKDTVAAMLEWFGSAHAIHAHSMASNHADAGLVQTLLEEIHQHETETPPTMGPVLNTQGFDVSSAVPIDAESGTLLEGCLKGCKLQPVPMSDAAWATMKSMNETIVLDGEIQGSKSEFQGGRKGRKRMDFSPQERKERWKHFTDFLATKDGLDVVIDGANVGYYKQNFVNSPKHVDYEQIDWVVKEFTKQGKRVLLVLHKRHFSDGMMPSQYKPLVDEWEKNGILYKTPAGMNDDWFWLHAALLFKSHVLTNDEMRDHHFQMLAPRIFLRWKERHQIHFSFGQWENGNTDKRQRQVELTYPPVYSRRIQRVGGGIVVPLAKRGDGNRFLDGVHVACDDEPIEETYLCIQRR